MVKDYTEGKKPDMLEPFFPNEILRHIIVFCFLVVIELIAVILFPLPVKLFDKPEHIPWFLLPIYLLDKTVQNTYAFISILIVFTLIFVFFPFIACRRRRNFTGGPEEEKQ